jgi:hypothetical protein
MLRGRRRWHSLPAAAIAGDGVCRQLGRPAARSGMHAERSQDQHEGRADPRRRRGNPASAYEVWRQALSIMDDLGLHTARSIRAKLAAPVDRSLMPETPQG